ncbi:hypothetical protein NECAME_14075 [Necator americanus]|uniref:Uncharacterized protein n=1 Tax=Necator americanus TaxID=51031 RepID=W2ST55_NECAM|nr:hypothetical protein NECAME_14075 [Necator americanus]ETN71872.1 hypothetical protein NECAME_14075 [Necator americanus]
MTCVLYYVLVAGGHEPHRKDGVVSFHRFLTRNVSLDAPAIRKHMTNEDISARNTSLSEETYNKWKTWGFRGDEDIGS